MTDDRPAVSQEDVEALGARLRAPGVAVPLDGAELRVLYDKLLVRRVAVETKTASGLELPQMALQDRTEGIVLATGAGRLLPDGKVLPLMVLPGDTVLFHAAQGIPMEDVAERLILLREDEVLAVRRTYQSPEQSGPMDDPGA